MDFPIVKKGYKPSEVDAYIEKQKAASEETIAAQHARIDELLHSLEEAQKELAVLRGQKDQIGKAILSSVKKSEEIEKLSKIKFAREMARLKAFHEKWTAYYEKLFDAYPLDDRLAALGAFNRRMDKILSGVRPSNETAATLSPERAKQAGKGKADKKVQIGYISVDADAEGATDVGYADIVPDADPSSPVLTGDFDPMERINRYFEAERERERAEAAATQKEYGDRSESGFSLEEALNPTEDLMDILKDLGL